jgi:hypothetical protein
MSITQIISQDSAESPQNRQKTTEQAFVPIALGAEGGSAATEAG